jgi:hypothetical protein
MDIISRIERLWPGLAVMACGIVVLGWGFWLPKRETLMLDFTSAELAPVWLELDGSPARHKARRMTIDYPAWMRLGDSAQVRLTFDIQPVDDDWVNPEDIPESYAVFVEASLEIPGLQVDPPFAAGQVLPPDQAATFWWTLSATKPGLFDGTSWLRLRFQSLSGKSANWFRLRFLHGSSEMMELKALAASRLQVAVRRFFVLSGPAARRLGGLAMALGCIWIAWRKFYVRSSDNGIRAGADERLPGG